MSSQTGNLLAIGAKLTSVTDPGNTVVTEQKEKAKSQGFELDVHTIDTSEPIGDILRDVYGLLDAKQYAAICIGFGVRGNRELTPLFEVLVNKTIEKQPQAKLGFAQTPHDMCVVIKSRALRYEDEDSSGFSQSMALHGSGGNDCMAADGSSWQYLPYQRQSAVKSSFNVIGI